MRDPWWGGDVPYRSYRRGILRRYVADDGRTLTVADGPLIADDRFEIDRLPVDSGPTGAPGGACREGRTMAGFQLTALIEREGDRFSARCVELDIERRGPTSEAALANLKDAVSSFVAEARDGEILTLLTREVEVTLFEIDRS